LRIHDETVSLVRERAKILDVFEGETLKKTGSEYLAQCPWHQDDHPSLGISPKKNFAYCPVCCRGVDALGWVMDREQLSFTEAVQQLANRYNVEIKAANPEDAERLAKENAERAQLLADRKSKANAYHDALFESDEGKAYFKSRGIERETAEAWQLGWDEKDRRVVFPLRDHQGRVVAFTKRVIDEGMKPKYKNSFNDLLYQKAKLTYGLDLAKSEIALTNQVVIVEGQMDVILLWQHGIKNAVAVSGSNLTSEMIKGLMRSTRLTEVVLCFDGDQGGELAQERAVTKLQSLALSGEIDLKILVCPQSTDPADNAERFSELLRSAVSWVEFMFERTIERLDLKDPTALAKAEKGIKEILGRLPKGAMRSWVQERAKEVLNVIPDIAPARVMSRQQQDRCDWTEYRAIRLLLYVDRPDHFEALMALNYQNDVALDLVSLLQMTEDIGPGQRRCWIGQVAQDDERLYDKLRPLLKPLGEIKQNLETHQGQELQEIWEVLAAECCEMTDGNPSEARM